VVEAVVAAVEEAEWGRGEVVEGGVVEDGE
jgi:hypothetical protein